MNKFMYFNFRNYVAVSVLDDGLFMEFICYYSRLNARGSGELKSTSDLPNDGGESSEGKLQEKSQDNLFQQTLNGLKPLMMEGLIVIGIPQWERKTSFGHFEIDQPNRPLEEALEAINKDYLEKGLEYVEVVWIVQATTKGWEWAQRVDREIPTEDYCRERKDFFGA